MGIPEFILSQEEQNTLDHILDLALEVAQAESGSLVLKDREGTFYIASGKGIRPEYLGKRVGKEEGSISSLVFERREPVVIDAHSPYSNRRHGRHHASVSLPVWGSDREVVGVLNLNIPSSVFPRENLPRLLALSESIGLLLTENLLRRQRERRILALSAIITHLASSAPCAASEEEAFAKFAQAVISLAEAKGVAIFRWASKRVYRVFTRDFPRKLTWKTLSPIHGEIFALFEARMPRFFDIAGETLLALPFVAGKRRYVLFALCESTLDTLDLLLLSVVASLCASCLENLRLLEETRKLAREAERSRLAWELHDGLAQILASEQIYLHFLTRELEDRESTSWKLLEKIRNLNTIGIEESRFILSELKGKPVLPSELEKDLARVVEHFLPPGLHVDTRISLPSCPLPFRIANTVVMVLREALSNIARHAEAHNVRIFLDVPKKRWLRLLVEDDGKGFREEDVGEGHFGLMNIRSRIRFVRGKLRIISSPGRGTRLEAFIPLEGESR